MLRQLVPELEDLWKVHVTSLGSLGILSQRVVRPGTEENWHWLQGTLYWALIDTFKECHAGQAQTS
ncbi:mCG1051092 [Mus musculus]|nr:mCG1051092 [Mus musculus]